VNWRPGHVWAPHAEAVSLVSDRGRTALERYNGGWWRADVELGIGERYGFVLGDDDRVLPDPWSRWQPDGVFDLSAVDDPDRHRWMSEAPRTAWSDAVVYELHVGTFTPAGTFSGVADRLDHLVELGVTHLELMPVGAWDGRWGWGYDGVAWWSPHPGYGSPEHLRHLIDRCHGAGLRVMLDVVSNHLGPSGAILDRFGPYTGEASTPWGQAINLDGPDSDPVRSALLDNAMMWLRDYRFDGLRLDAVHAMFDASPTPFVAQLAAEVELLGTTGGRGLDIVAEWDRHDPTPVLGRSEHGWGLAAHWADDLHHALHVTLTGESAGYYADAAADADRVKTAMEQVYQPRVVTGDPASELSARGITRDHFVVCAQNHDQIGNRPRGERLVELAGVDAAMAAATVVLLGPSIPLLFQGEEWGTAVRFPFFSDFTDPSLAKAITEGRRRELAELEWDDVADPCDPETFMSARLNWDELVQGSIHGEVNEWYRALIDLRRRFIDPRSIDEVTAEMQGGRLTWTIGRLTASVNLGASSAPLEPTFVRPTVSRRILDNSGAPALDRWGVAVTITEMPPVHHR